MRTKNIKKIFNKNQNNYKCEDFCKNDYMIEQERVFQKLNKNFKMPHKKRTKKQLEFDFNVCKKVFCNKKCEGFDNLNLKKIKNGFHKTYKNQTHNLKKRGAISGCINKN